MACKFNHWTFQKEIEMMSPIGGRIFYIGPDNGVTYQFFDTNGDELTNITIEGLANAAFYKRGDGASTGDRFYVYDNTSHTTYYGTDSYTTVNGILDEYNYIMWFDVNTVPSGLNTDTIGSGKSNTQKLLDATDAGSKSLVRYIKGCRESILNGCND